MYSERSLRKRKPKPIQPPSPPMDTADGIRKRKANFSMEEKFMLVNGYKKYKHMLGKDSDASLECRAKLWQDITDKFNDEVSQREGMRAVKRTVQEVRKKWRAMCTQARRNRQDMEDNVVKTGDNYDGWIDKQFELDTDIMNLLGELEGEQSDDAWSEVGTESPAERRWPTTKANASLNTMSPHTLPVQAPRRVNYNSMEAEPQATNAVTPVDVTPIILHTKSLAGNALGENSAPTTLTYVDDSDYIQKKRSLELEKMELENSILKMKLAKATLEVELMKANMTTTEDDKIAPTENDKIAPTEDDEITPTEDDKMSD